MFNNLKASTSKILQCDTSCISFAASAELPQISDPATLSNLQTAAAALQANELVAFPTETVYGLGGSALASSSAISKIFKTKGRPSDNPLIVHVSSSKQLGRLIDEDQKDHLPSSYAPLMAKFWPGPLTLLFPTVPGRLVSENVTCGLSTVGIRVPSHPVARALIALADVPVAAPSANLSGKPSPTTARHVEKDLFDKQDLMHILNGGDCSVGLESTVVSALRDGGKGKAADAGLSAKEVLRVLRLGGISPEQLQACLNEAGLGDIVDLQVETDWADATQDNTGRKAHSESAKIPSTPGMKYKHYSPDAIVILLQPSLSEEALELAAAVRPHQGKKIGFLRVTSSPLSTSLRKHIVIDENFDLGEAGDYGTHAQRLFSGLRGLDEAGVDIIFVECVPEKGLGRSIMERLRKSAGCSDSLLVRL